MNTTDTSKWESRPTLARVLRLAVAVAPLVMAVAVVIVAGHVVSRPGSLLKVIIWWIGLTGLATTVVWLADRALRQLLPVVALFKLSLVFPDRAPSRFKAAIRSGTVRQLQRDVESGAFGSVTPQQAAEQLIALAGSLNAHDRLTRGHTERVRAYAAMIGEEMGFETEELELLNWSGLVHDIGKLMVPPEILNKPGKPTDEEWVILRDHPAQADALVEPLRPWLGQWAESATQHHERYDGAGYPKGLAGDEITLAGRIVAVADAYDVMTSTRSYKKPMPAAEARAELARNAGTQFDPDVVRAFLNVAIGRLRLVMGPLSSLVQFPAGSATLGSSVATGVGAVGAVAVAAVIGALSGPPEPIGPIPEAVAYVAPEAVDIDVEGNEDEPITIGVAALLAEPIDSIEVTDQPEPGTATVSESGEIVFEPAPDFHGTVSVGYRVCFVGRICDEAVLTITIRNINDAPTANPDRGSTVEDTSTSVEVLVNDRDVDDDRLVITSATIASEPDAASSPARVEIDGGSIVVTPGVDSWGDVVVEYTVADPGGLRAMSTLAVEVIPVDDPPLAVADAVTGYENTPVEFDVLANDSDVDGDTLTIVSVSSVRNGTATTDGASVTFVPEARYVGPAGLSYIVSDGTSSARAQVDIDVVDITSTPVVVDDAATLDEDASVSIDVVANDSGLFAGLNLDSLTIVRSPEHGIATWDGVTVQYAAPADWSGEDSLEYVLCDVAEFCNKATVTLTVKPVNDMPTLAVGSNLWAPEDATTQTIVGWASTDPGPDDESTQTVTYNVVNTNNALFAIQPTIDPAGQLSYTPAPDANGNAILTITATDSGGTANGGIDTTPPIIATISVAPVNDQPALTAGPDLNGAEDSGLQLHPGWALTTPGPTDESTQTVTYTVVNTNNALFATQPTIDPAGQLSYTPSADANGTAILTITATDSGGTANGGIDTTAPTTATITIAPVNDDPVSIDDPQALAEDSVGITFDVLANDSDVDGDTVQYGSAVTGTVANGIITDNADGTFTYVPDEHFNGVETFTYTAIDGNGGSDTATVTITVAALPDAPVAGNDARATAVDTPLNVSAPGLLANDYDVDGEALTVNITPVVAPTNGTVTLHPDGSYLYTPGSGFVGNDSFTYEISDPGGTTATATVAITVDSGIVAVTYYLGDTGSASWDYDLVTSVPASSVPPFDSDGDGDPGLTINNGSGSEFEVNPGKYQVWSMTAGSPIDLDGPVVLDLWASVEDYNPSKNGHPYVYLYDCLGFSCTKLAEADIHFDPFNKGVANFVNQPVDLGSITHTVPPGRALVVKLVFKHSSMWVAMTADYPSALNVTMANVAPVAAADSLTIDEDASTTNVAVLANDTDADIDTGSVTIVSPASIGTATPVGDGTVDYTPDPDANGVDSFDYQVCDLGGNCDTATVTVTVNSVNDEPTFAGGGNVVAAGFGPSTFAAWAGAIDRGATNEVGQILTFTVTGNDNPGLFTTGPAVDPSSGDLTFDAGSSGLANVTIFLSDDGGTANGGDDTSSVFGFTITIP